MRLTIAAAFFLIAAMVGAAIAQQPPAPAPGPTAPTPGAGMGRMGPFANPEQILDMMMARLGLTEAEKAAAKKAVRAKTEAATALQQALRELGEAARNEKATDKELSAALKKFNGALAAYRQKIKAIDAQLIKALSLKAQAGLTAIGVIDNGMGMRFGGRMRPAGGGQRAPGGRGSGGSSPGAQGPQVIR